MKSHLFYHEVKVMVKPSKFEEFVEFIKGSGNAWGLVGKTAEPKITKGKVSNMEFTLASFESNLSVARLARLSEFCEIEYYRTRSITGNDVDILVSISCTSIILLDRFQRQLASIKSKQMQHQTSEEEQHD